MATAGRQGERIGSLVGTCTMITTGTKGENSTGMGDLAKGSGDYEVDENRKATHAGQKETTERRRKRKKERKRRVGEERERKKAHRQKKLLDHSWLKQ